MFHRWRNKVFVTIILWLFGLFQIFFFLKMCEVDVCVNVTIGPKMEFCFFFIFILLFISYFVTLKKKFGNMILCGGIFCNFLHTNTNPISTTRWFAPTHLFQPLLPSLLSSLLSHSLSPPWPNP